MRRRNMRIVIVGFVLIVMALVFFMFMRSIASTSNDPVSLVGTVTGVVTGISVVMIIAGLIGKRT